MSGQLLDQAKFDRRLGVTAHRRPDDDDDDRNEDDDLDERSPHHRGRKLGHVKFIAGNYLGSTALVMNHRGRVLARPEFGPWGEPLEGSFARVKFGYTGHRIEERTGHWSALHRQLDPRAGRWTQRDPLGMIDGTNRYAYVANGPLSAVDPAGLRIIPPTTHQDIFVTVKYSRTAGQMFKELDDCYPGDIRVVFSEFPGKRVGGQHNVLPQPMKDMQTAFLQNPKVALASLGFGATGPEIDPVTGRPRSGNDVTVLIFLGSDELLRWGQQQLGGTIRLESGASVIETNARLRLVRQGGRGLFLAGGGTFVHELTHLYAELKKRPNPGDESWPRVNALTFWSEFGFQP